MRIGPKMAVTASSPDRSRLRREVVTAACCRSLGAAPQASVFRPSMAVDNVRLNSQPATAYFLLLGRYKKSICIKSHPGLYEGCQRQYQGPGGAHPHLLAGSSPGCLVPTLGGNLLLRPRRPRRSQDRPGRGGLHHHLAPVGPIPLEKGQSGADCLGKEQIPGEARLRPATRSRSAARNWCGRCIRPRATSSTSTISWGR